MADYTSSKTGAEVDSAVTQVEDSGLTGSGGDATFTGEATFSGGIVTVTSTSAGVSGAFVDGWHNSASPAANDQLLTIRAFGENDASEQSKYGTIVFLLTDPTDGSEDGRWQFQQLVAGVDTAVLRSNAGGGISIPVGNLTLDTGDLIITASSTPASAGATGTAGTIAWDSSYLYVCVATNTWKRVAIATW